MSTTFYEIIYLSIFRNHQSYLAPYQMPSLIKVPPHIHSNRYLKSSGVFPVPLTLKKRKNKKQLMPLHLPNNTSFTMLLFFYVMIRPLWNLKEVLMRLELFQKILLGRF